MWWADLCSLPFSLQELLALQPQQPQGLQELQEQLEQELPEPQERVT